MEDSSAKRILILLLASVYFNPGSGTNDCARRDFGKGNIVCVCNATYCDVIKSLLKLESPNYQVFTSNKAGLRLRRTTGVFETYNNRLIDLNKVTVNKNKKYQIVFGFGGAFSDAAGINIKSLDEATQNKLLSSYFSTDGLEYNVGRVPIGGTDFSVRGYSYDDTDTADVTLSNFALQREDYDYKIPIIKKALNLNSDLQLLAAAWIAPKWMKTNGEYAGTGRIKDNMYQVWADYHKKFFDAYKNETIKFWAVSTGNEPSLALAASLIPSNGWNFKEMQRWIGDHLGPTIRNSEHKDLKILMLDDQTTLLPQVKLVLQNRTVKDYVDMIGIHWYHDDFTPAFIVDTINNKYPSKSLMSTEGCIGDRPLDKAVDLGSWARGERYASDIIEDMEHNFVGWLDWNMALDLTGGPTYINNNVDSPIIVNATAGEFYKQPMYYSLGHFSKFVPRGSVRIDVSGPRSIATTAFTRPDGGTVVILQNKGLYQTDIKIVDKEKGKISLKLSGQSLTTVIYY